MFKGYGQMDCQISIKGSLSIRIDQHMNIKPPTEISTPPEEEEKKEEEVEIIPEEEPELEPIQPEVEEKVVDEEDKENEVQPLQEPEETKGPWKKKPAT